MVSGAVSPGTRVVHSGCTVLPMVFQWFATRIQWNWCSHRAPRANDKIAKHCFLRGVAAEALRFCFDRCATRLFATSTLSNSTFSWPSMRRDSLCDAAQRAVTLCAVPHRSVPPFVAHIRSISFLARHPTRVVPANTGHGMLLQ